MLWASEVLGRDGKPAVLLLSAKRTTGAVTAELAYVAAELPEGPVRGRYYRTAGSEGEPVALDWPGGWPTPGPLNKLHPRKGTPEAALTEVGGERRVTLRIIEGEHLSNEQAES